MDLGALLQRGGASGSDGSESGSNPGGSTSSVGSTSSMQKDNSSVGEGGRRGELYQNIRKGMMASKTEARALRASQTSNRRKELRDEKHLRNRANMPVDESDEVMESNVAPKKSRKELLEEYRLKKKLEKENTKKSSKPAFKAGYVHHSIAPIGAGTIKPNDYEKNINRGKKGNTSVFARSTSNLGQKGRQTPASLPSKRSTKPKNSILGLKKAEAVNRKNLEAKSVKAATSPIPEIMLTPAPEEEPKSSKSSTGSFGKISFAPENFQFQAINIPTISTPLKKLMGAPKLDTFSASSDETDSVFLEEEESDKVQQDQNKTEDKNVQNVASPTTSPELRGRTRSRRSRRMSGVQPDPNIPHEELAKTPARKVKERSLSGTRRSSMLLSDDAFEHEVVATPRRTGAGASTPGKTPRTGRKTARATTLPPVSESSPSHEESDSKEQTNSTKRKRISTRRSTRKSSNNEVAKEIGMEISLHLAPVAAEVSPSASPRPRMGTKVSSLRRSTRLSNIHSCVQAGYVECEENLLQKDHEVMNKDNDNISEDTTKIDDDVTVEEMEEKEEVKTNDDTEVMFDKLYEEAIETEPMQDGVSEMEGVEVGSTPVTRKSARKSSRLESMEVDVTEKSNTPVNQQKSSDFQFKTPTINSVIKRPKSTTKKNRILGSPYIDERKSLKRKYSLSETKAKNSINSMFDDIPDGDSPLHAILEKKFRSSDQVNPDEVEEILAQFRVQSLSENRKQALTNTFQQLGTEADEEQERADEKVVAVEDLTDSDVATATEDVRASVDLTSEDVINTEEQTNEVSEQVVKAAENEDSKNKVTDNVKEDEHTDHDDQQKQVLVMAKAVEGQEESEHDVLYFRNLLDSETKRITAICQDWESRINPEIPEDFQGQIRSVVGQGRLIMAERFKQFSGLVDNCEYGTGERTTSCMDLEGFWEMIYFQVIDVDKKFEELEKLQQNGWKELEVVPQKAVAKKRVIKKGAAVSASKGPSGLRAHILASRKAAMIKSKSESCDPEIDSNSENKKTGKPSIRDMIAAKRAALQKNKSAGQPEIMVQPPTSETKVEGEVREFDGGFFNVKSPVRPQSAEKKRSPTLDVSRSPSGPCSPVMTLSPSSRSRSTGGDRLRRAVLTDSARRLSGMVSPFVSQMSRRSLEQTSSRENSPQKSKPVRRSTLFDDMDTENEGSNETAATSGVVGVANKVTVDQEEIADPVTVTSPVTKTYSRDNSFDATEHEQIMESQFDQLLQAKDQNTGPSDDMTPGRDLKQLLQPTRSSGRKSRNVKFAGSDNSTSVEIPAIETTPHPTNRRRSTRRLQNDENAVPSPNLIDL